MTTIGPAATAALPKGSESLIQIAWEVHRAARLGERRVSKVTSFLHMFGLSSATSWQAQAVEVELRRMGVQLEPSLADAPRNGCITLSAAPDWEPASGGVREPVIRVSIGDRGRRQRNMIW